MMLYVPMTATEFRACLAAIPLSQLAFSRLLSVAPRTVRSWALAERQIPPHAAMIARLLATKRITVKQLQHAAMTQLNG
ncbi:MULTISPECIES: hypothetical protein [unclassified Mesorhizobium]|uniref:hypothetical protein n=1 Tax=unclassified Mesorhizobium TaxID=325217 RepID=UPI003339C8C8